MRTLTPYCARSQTPVGSASCGSVVLGTDNCEMLLIEYPTWMSLLFYPLVDMIIVMTMGHFHDDYLVIGTEESPCRTFYIKVFNMCYNNNNNYYC